MHAFRPQDPPQKLLLHVCCGPCSTAPVRTLRQRGVELCLHFANSNIAPVAEYEHRLQTARSYAEGLGIPFVEGNYRPQAWADVVRDVPVEVRISTDGMTPPPERCRACYRLRFTEAARYAAGHGFSHVGTTLSVSPYQYRDIIHEELERACAAANVEPFFEDYSPLYPETMTASKEAGLYRQDYCGCLPSKSEADAGRSARRAEREARKVARAEVRKEAEAALDKRRAERASYDVKQARKRALKNALRAKG